MRYQPRHAKPTTRIATVALALAAVTSCGSYVGAHRAQAHADELIAATYPACGQQGSQIAAYLSTGSPAADTPYWGNQRQAVLALSGARQSLYISQVADQVISQCDTTQTAAAAAQRQQAAAQAYQNTASSTCAAITGHRYGQWPATGWDGRDCNVDYLGGLGSMKIQLSISGSGAVDPKSAFISDTVPESQCQAPGQWSAAAQLCVVSGN